MKVLVGVDLSESTEMIVERSKDIAKAMSAQVWLLHVAEPEPDFVGSRVDPHPSRDSIAKGFHREHCQIQELADRLRNIGLDTTALFIQGATAETILYHASKLDVDMIIIGSHGRGAMYQLLVGSTSEQVIHGSGCPVLVVPTHKRT